MSTQTAIVPDAWSLEAVERFALLANSNSNTYEIGVGLPASYRSSDRHYPAIVILDANLCFAMALDMARLQAATGEIAELIVIGVGTPRLEGVGAHALKRLRDFTPSVPDFTKGDGNIARMLLERIEAAGMTEDQAFGGADAFLSFLSVELLPLIQTRYRCDSSSLGLCGHSAGGVFALDAMLSPAAPFNRYILGSFPGSWLRVDPSQQIPAIRPDKGGHIRAFYGVGGAELESGAMGADLRAGLDALERAGKLAGGGIEITWRIFPEETHTSVISHLISSGLRWQYSTGLGFTRAAAVRAAAAHSAKS